MNKLLYILIFLLYFVVAKSQTKDIPYTLDDRDRLIRVEEQIKSMNVKIDAKFEEMNAKFVTIDTKFEAMDNKINKLYTLIYFVLGGVFGLIGFVIYDRKTALTPVTNDTRKLKEILHELAKNNPELKNILNKAEI